MKGDFSRFTFDSKNRYSRVLMQQGRVQLDADWNEQLNISAYRTETEITDFIGQNGAPESPIDSKAKEAYLGDLNYQSTSFRITTEVADSSKKAANSSKEAANVFIGPGRYYVEGMLFENHVPVAFNQQPDYPGVELPTGPGIYLAYLDVWQHHVTALEVPNIREAALGGADTTTRVKNVWQVKLELLGTTEKKTEILDSLSKYTAPNWKPDWEIAMSENTLTATATPEAITENQLYRIEIHQANGSEVSFKWSRDNGAIAAQVEAFNGNVIKIRSAGQDPQLAFPLGTLVELNNETRTLQGQLGVLATVQGVQGNQLTVEWNTPKPEKPEKIEHAIVRRWDSKGAVRIGSSGTAHDLEQSIKVSFTGENRYKTGDYWLLPTRALTDSIEWLNKPQRPHGIEHRYCSLALLQRTANGFSVLTDCRSIFKPITSGLLSKAGDTMTGDLTINKNLYVVSNVGIGEIDPKQKFVVTAGKAAVGYNDSNQTVALAVNGSVGIGISKLVQPFTPARLVVQSEIGNKGESESDPQAVLSLVRDGFPGASWCNIADFRIGRYDDGLTFTDPAKGNLRLRSRTQLDIVLSHGNYDAPQEKEWNQNIMTLRSDGNVGIGTTTPQAKLEVSGILQATKDNQNLIALHIKSTFDNKNKAAVQQNGLIVENGNVGIGTTTPNAKFEVRGGLTKLQQEDWQNIPLPPGYTPDSDFTRASYFKDSFGIVHFRGVITWHISNSRSLFTLPDGYRPQASSSQTVWLDDPSSNINGPYSARLVFIEISGEVILSSPATNIRIYIEGMTFKAA